MSLKLAAAALVEYITGRLLNEALNARNPTSIRKARLRYETARRKRDRLRKKNAV